MRTRIYLGLAMCALFMANCSQEDNNPLMEGNNHVISATIESAIKSRSTVTEGGKFAWAQGDEISVAKKDGGFATFVYSDGNNFALKQGEESSAWGTVAYYPANASHTSSTFVLPAEYNLEGNTMNTHAPMKAVIENGNADNLSFTHLGGVLRFKFRNVPADANKFVFTATDKDITGDFTISEGVIEAKTATSKNTISFNFTAGQSSEKTFYVPMPVGTYNGMSVAFYEDSNKLWETSTTATNEIRRALLLLMPPLFCTANSSTASSSADVSNALGNNTEASVNLKGEAAETTEITIPESFTEATQESNLNLTYNEVPSTTGTITISDANKGAEQSESKGHVNISIPNVADVSEAPSFNINLPTMTVTLQANIENAVYNEVTASTANNTLRIAKGVTVKKLILNGGNIVIEADATVNEIVNKQGFDGKTYVVVIGSLTKIPNLSNVNVVDSEEDIPSGLPYELRVLTFEDEDAKFSPYTLDYADVDITTWSDLIDDRQYGGSLTYGDYMSAMYTWYDENNTELTHTFPSTWGTYCYWSGGHAISNYWGAGYTNEDRDKHISKYYGEDYVTENAGNDSMLGWFNVQWMVPVPAHSGENFAVHYGYIDGMSMCENLPEISFADGEARVIDHMYVCNTNYTLNQLVCGVGSESGNTFGGSWTGLSDDAWLKIVAYGFENIDDEEHTKETEFYLVNGQNVVENWQKWDLSPLGKVAKVQFNFLYSSEMGGKYGFTIPGYFAYDDVAVRFEK